MDSKTFDDSMILLESMGSDRTAVELAEQAHTLSHDQISRAVYAAAWLSKHFSTLAEKLAVVHRLTCWPAQVQQQAAEPQGAPE